MPAKDPGLGAILSYFSAGVKVNAEGDVTVNDDTIESLGMTRAVFPTIMFSMFGTVGKLLRPQLRDRSLAMVDSNGTAPGQQQQAAHWLQGNTYGVHDQSGPNIYYESYHKESSFATTDSDILESGFPIAAGSAPASRKKEEEKSSQHPYQTLPQRLKADWRVLTDVFPNSGYFLAGAVAGIVSRTSTAPLDRLKVYLINQTEAASKAVKAAQHGSPLQATKHAATPLINAMRELWAAGGMRSLFAGKLTTSLYRCCGKY